MTTPSSHTQSDETAQDVERATTGTPLRERWHSDPQFRQRAAFGWAFAYAVFGFACVMTGTPTVSLGTHQTSWLVWLPLGTAMLAMVVLSAVATQFVPRRLAFALLWGVCALIAVMAFGLLMDVVTLMFNQAVDSWPRAANHGLAAVGALLLVTVARRHRHVVCDRCGAVHEPSMTSQPSTAPRRVQIAAWAGAAAFLPYAGMKTIWAIGGTFAGTSGAEMHEASRRNGASDLFLTLGSWGIDPTVLLAALGIFLIFGLVRPWGQVFPRWALALRGRRVPRWLPLTPGIIGAATLAPYGVIGVGWAILGTAGVVTVPPGDFHSSADALLVSWIGLGAFAVYGFALLIASHSYWRRTRSVC